MISRGLAGAAAASLLLAFVLFPVDAAAQDGEISLPPESGDWTGRVLFSGYHSTDVERGDGSFDATVTDVIEDTFISLAFVVGADGQITSGTMWVDLIWFTESAGTSPSTNDPYHIESAQFQEGTLSISGGADRLVASGTLSHTTDVNSARYGEIEEVSSTEDREVEWTFQLVEVNCAFASGEILWSSGVSLMNRVWQPDSDSEHNALEVKLVAWPAGLTEDPAALAEVSLAEDRIRQSDYPEAEDLLDLVEAWNRLNAELAGYDQCQAEQLGWTATAERSWLTSVVQEALGKALDNSDYYKPYELSWLWSVGLQLQALDEALMSRFLDVFDQKLDQAIALSDTDALVSIEAFAGAYGYDDLYDKAHQALEGASG